MCEIRTPLPIYQRKYNLKDILTPYEYIYIKIERGMYVLLQEAILLYDHLRTCLALHRCALVVGTVGLWKHETRSTHLCVYIDDFGVKYFNKNDADHLL